MDYYWNWFSTKCLPLARKNNIWEVCIEHLLFSDYTQYCNICHPISLQNRSLLYFILYFHFQAKPADFPCTFSFWKLFPGNDLISPPNQKRLDYNYKAVKTGNVVNSDTVLTMLVQMTLWNFLKCGQSPLVYMAFWPLISRRAAWQTASLTVKSSPGHMDQVGIFMILLNHNTFVFNSWWNYSNKSRNKI